MPQFLPSRRGAQLAFLAKSSCFVHQPLLPASVLPSRRGAQLGILMETARNRLRKTQNHESTAWASCASAQRSRNTFTTAWGSCASGQVWPRSWSSSTSLCHMEARAGSIREMRRNVMLGTRTKDMPGAETFGAIARLLSNLRVLAASTTQAPVQKSDFQ